jgi:hypothetical protein
MMKKMNLLIVMLLMVANIAGQQLNLTGRVFEPDGDKVVTYIPFATVYYYNYEDTTKVEFCTLTNLAGEYFFYNLRNGKYIVKIVAPGYQTKRQEIEFRDVQSLAKNNKGKVYAHIEMKKVNNTHITPVIFQAQDLLQSKDDTIEKIIEGLKVKVKNNTASEKKSYRIWLGGMDIDAKLYNEMKVESLMKLAKGLGDKTLQKTYIEYYDLSGEN